MSQIGQKLRVDFVETATPEIGQNLRQRRNDVDDSPKLSNKFQRSHRFVENYEKI